MNEISYTASRTADTVNTELEYAGFWVRTGAGLIDMMLMLAISCPILYAVYGAEYFGSAKNGLVKGPADFLLTYVAPAIASILFWLHKQGTPGKLAFSLRILDSQTGKTLSRGQAIGRYLAYYPSMIPLFLGIFWVGIDARKQGWHDKLAKTVVVRPRRPSKTPVVFAGKA